MLPPPFFIVRAPGSVGAFWVVAGTAPVPFAAIAQEYVHSQCFLNSKTNLMYPGGLHL